MREVHDNDGGLMLESCSLCLYKYYLENKVVFEILSLLVLFKSYFIG